ncbi:unnamed protein product [[Candida] boidinii]|uniref:Unnamed protein product n=1 Tax=Candida boidinii TaxID=5477 RepID=A0A9W6W7J2_CANBO|nr:hypothetical protein B5S30_g758 [[Candida] boidinii]GME67147.1 unnamed protein product [[Candida] boidinii]GMF98598.1 unnamed protein product [[Candida] boidinii]
MNKFRKPIIEIYVWGDGTQVAEFDAESIAICWFLGLCNLYDYRNFIKIIPNSNYFISPNGKLPFLKIDNSSQFFRDYNNIASGNTNNDLIQIQGYKNIVNFFENNLNISINPKNSSNNINNNNTNNDINNNNNSDMNNNMNNDSQNDITNLNPNSDSIEYKILQDGLTEYVVEYCNIITNYCLFVNKENYEQFTRKLFPNYLPFPLQYNSTIEFRNNAIKICESYGLTDSNNHNNNSSGNNTNNDNGTELDEIKLIENNLKNLPVLNHNHKTSVTNQISELVNRKNYLINLNCIHFTDDFYYQLTKFKKELKINSNSNSNSNTNVNSKFIFSDLPTTAEILLYSNLYIQTIKNDLPNKFMKIFIEEKYNDFIKRIKLILNNCNNYHDLIIVKKLNLNLIIKDLINYYIL